MESSGGRFSLPTRTESFRRRVYLAGALSILGALVSIYVVLVSLWATCSLDHDLFSVSRVDTITKVILVMSQFLSVSALACLGFLVQAIASDQTLRRNQKLAALHDDLDAWYGLGSSIVSLWRGKHLGNQLRIRVLLVFLFFASGSVLQITAPATVTVESTNSTVSLSLRVSLMPGNVDDIDFVSLSWDNGTGLLTTLSALPYVSSLGSNIGTPAGVQDGIFFSTLEDSLSNAVHFEDPYALQPTIKCASIPRHKDDVYAAEWSVPDDTSGVLDLHFDTSAIIEPSSGILASYSGYSTQAPSGEATFCFETENRIGNLTTVCIYPYYLQYLAWTRPDTTPNYGYSYGNIAFQLISLANDTLDSNSTRGSNPAIETTIKIPLRPLNSSSNVRNTTITLYQWPIGCSFYLEQTNATVRGDNQLVSSGRVNPPTASTAPFVRSEPATTLERTFGRMIDTTWSMETSSTEYDLVGQYIPSYWLEQKLVTILNQTNMSSSLRLDAVETMLQNLTSTAYALLVQGIRTGSEEDGVSSGSKLAYASVSGRQDDAIFAKLQVHGLPVVIGLVCVLVLAGCTLVSTRLGRPFSAHDDGVMLAGGVVDVICLMYDSALPGLLAQPPSGHLYSDERRSKAEILDVMYSEGKLDLSGRIVEQPAFPDDFENEDEHYHDYLAMTERALVRNASLSAGDRSGGHYHRSTLNSYTSTAPFILGVLVLVHVALLLVGVTHVLNSHPFDISRIGLATQSIGVGSQVLSVTTLSALGFIFQKVAADKFIRQHQSVAALHDSLGALTGLGAASVAIWRGVRFSRRLVPAVWQVSLFWACMAVLHITMPVSISVNVFNSSHAISVQANTMPGHLVNLEFEWDANNQVYDFASGNLESALSVVPYLLAQENTTITLPPGLNGTAYFSTPVTNTSASAILDDPFAKILSVQCGVIPSKLDDLQSFKFSGPESVNDSNSDSTMEFRSYYGYQNPTNVWQNFSSRDEFRPWGDPPDFTVGGKKSSMDATPTFTFNDRVIFSDPSFSNTSAPEGSFSFSFISIRPDAFPLPSGLSYAPPAQSTANITMISWVNETSQTSFQSKVESINVTFYVWPMGCALITSNITASVRGDSILLSYNTTTSASRTAMPFLSGGHSDIFARLWLMLIEGTSQTELLEDSEQPAWIQQALNASYASRRDITSIEATLAHIASFSYAVVVEQYRQRYTQGDPKVQQYWQPETAILQGTQPVLLAKLAINWIPLIIGLASTIILALVTLTCVWGHDVVDPIIRDGRMIDLISLLCESTLPEVLAGNSDGESRTRNEIRRLAERTRVAYGQGSLDLPGRIQRRLFDYPSGYPLTLPEPANQETSYLIK